ncbi:hypothetical protein TNIN_230701 [Trichonephila inaurata madagascariensis]|uniref:Uncharacterized protein n=1 Tax=Trichonephila inaurata madagascariensis TaxID=2747483 RepID=A0A8X7CC93_9ARAC|nr:hypothetical protein TNIN_230701 [Trichonephila inaurata madagascariensis]
MIQTLKMSAFQCPRWDPELSTNTWINKSKTNRDGARSKPVTRSFKITNNCLKRCQNFRSIGPETAELSRLEWNRFVVCLKMKKKKRVSCSDKTLFLMVKKHRAKRSNGLKNVTDSCPSKAALSLVAEFKRGRTDTNDAERSGRPVEAVTPENVR